MELACNLPPSFGKRSIIIPSMAWKVAPKTNRDQDF